MKKILSLLFILSIVTLTFLYTNSYANTDSNNLFFPNISKRTTPNDLLVMVFLYDDYTEHNERIDYVFNMTDEEIEAKYHNEIFGSGNIEEQTWSVNDFYKENSNGNFYFNPILIGNNTTGIYPIRINKIYDQNNFSSDIKEGFKTLTDQGFIPTGFDAKVLSGITQEKQVLCIFPKLQNAHVGSYFLSENIYSNVAVTAFSSNVTTITHELGHTLEMPDLYGQNGQCAQASLMSGPTLRLTVPDIRYPGNSGNYTLPNHVDPLHKIGLGWYNYELVDEDTTVKLYPTTSHLYNIVIVPTEDTNQFFIIENRKADSFESQITLYSSRADVDDPEDAGYQDYEGINIWRVDKLGYNELNASQTSDRRGDFIISVLQNPKDAFFPKMYSNISDSASNLKKNTNIKITYIKNNDDNSIDVDITFDDKFTNQNSYVVRYNANDGTNNYIDNMYTYGQNINFSVDLFSRPEYELVGWNTEQDGSGVTYNVNDMIYGLTNDDGAIVNLYAQWKKNSYTIQFDANGGNGIMEDKIVENGQYILPECEFTNSNSNYGFAGWFIESENTVLKPGAAIYVNDDTKLIAQWKEIIKYTVSFNTDGGSPVENQIIEEGEKALEPAIPIKEGFKFGGWYEDSTYQFWFYFERPITANTTLYAKWIPEEFIIKEMNIEVPLPIVGDTVTIDKAGEYWDLNTQKPQLDIKIADDDNYKVADDYGAYMFWVTDFGEEVNPFVGTFEYDKDYYVRILLTTKDEYIFDRNKEIIVNGKQVDRIFYSDDCNTEIGVILTTPKKSEHIEYMILEGGNQTYTKSKGNNLTIKANGDLSKFLELKVDNDTVYLSNYSVISGSTVITLKNAYLDTLSEGEHSLTFVYSDGNATTNFKIAKSEATSNENIIGGKASENQNVADSNLDKKINNHKSLSPQTGDNIVIWICLLITSCIGIIVTSKQILKK